MSVPRTALSTLIFVAALLVVADRTNAQTPPLSPEVRDAIGAYLRDPAANAQRLVDAALQENALNPVHALVLGDAAIRAGQYRTASELFAMVQGAGLASAAEIGLAWASLGRGRLTDAYQHFGAAGSLDPSLNSLTDFGMALVSAASGSPGGRAAIATAAGRENLDSRLAEVAPLLDAYARYWTRDAAGAAEAFTAYAVAHRDSRFADDALYAAAQAKRRAGREDEAIADLEALAGDADAGGRLSSRLLALDGRALLREGMRRDRGRPFRLLPQRLADLLDGDGVRLAQAALAGRKQPEEPDESGIPTPAQAPARAGEPATAATAAADDTPSGARRSARPRAATPAPPVDLPDLAAGAVKSPRGARFPWTVVLALLAPIVLLGLWLFGRGTRSDQARSR